MRHCMSTKRLKAKWWFWLAHRKADRSDYRSALIHCHQILSLFPKWAYVHVYIGYCHMGLEQYEEAVKAFDNGLQIQPNSAYARAQLGSIFVRMGRYQQG